MLRSVLVEVKHRSRGLLTGMLDTQRAHEHAALLRGIPRAPCTGGRRAGSVRRANGTAWRPGAKSMESTASTLAAMDEQFREPLNPF